MSKGIESNTGPYLHAADAKWTKEFPGGRRFIVLIAGAYNAGIVGPEHMDFCTSNPRYRQGSIPDAAAITAPVMHKPEDRALPLQEAADTPEQYRVPSRTREEVIDFLAQHSFHRETPWGDFSLSWNIKVYHFDSSGKEGNPEANPAFDARWEAFVEKKPELFYTVCGDALREYLENEYSTYPGDDMGHYGFHTAGRSGGHLVLTRVEGIPSGELKWESKSDLLDSLRALDDQQLVKLYRLVVSLDRDLSEENKAKAMARGYSDERAFMESEWAQEEQDAQSEEEWQPAATL